MELAALPTLKDLDDVAFNPFEAEAVEYGDFTDTYERLRALRRAGDVQQGSIYSLFMNKENEALKGVPSYIVLGYDLVYKVLTDAATFTSGAYKQTLGKSFGPKSLSTLDPPEHTAYRRIFQKAFLPDVVLGWGETVIMPVVDEMVSRFEKNGSADLVSEFTRTYPFQVIYKQLGLDDDARKLFHKMAITQTLYRGNLVHAMDAGHKLGAFLLALVHERQKEPADDLVTHLSNVEVDGERLPDEVIVSFFRQLLNAAADTTYRATSNTLTGLLTNPDQLAAVRADSSLIPQAIDEGVRWESPSMTISREVDRDVELGGVALVKGAAVDVVIGSANRDEAKFPNPDRFDIFRGRTARPYPFGAGPHMCLGQHLAKVEMAKALGALVERLPNLRLDETKPAPQIVGFHLRTPAHLHVRFD